MRKSIKFLLISIVVFLFISSYFIFREVDKVNAATNKKQEDIKHLFKIMEGGLNKMGSQMLTPIISRYKEKHKDIPDKYWDDLFKEMFNDIMKFMIPRYEKHFTHEDIKGLIKFHESPLGKKMIRVQPLIMKEMMPKITKWSKTLSKKIKDKLKKEDK